MRLATLILLLYVFKITLTDCVCVWWGMYVFVRVHMQYSCLFFHHVCPGNPTQVMRLVGVSFVCRVMLPAL